MSRQNDSSELFNRFGAEVKGTFSGLQVRNASESLKLPDPSSQVTRIRDANNRGASGVKYDIAVGFFQRKGVPISLARTYGALLIDASSNTGKDISEFIEVVEDGKVRFTDSALVHANFFRPKTSQIGYKEPTRNSESLVSRRILP